MSVLVNQLSEYVKKAFKNKSLIKNHDQAFQYF